MAGLKLMTQGGYNPRAAAHLLQDNEAQRAINTKLYAGDLRAWFKPSYVMPLFEVAVNTKTIYKGKDDAGDDLWLAWLPEVDVVRNPITDSLNPMSIYYTGDGTPKKTNSTLAGTSQGQPPAAYLNMGVEAPAAAPSVVRVGSGGSPETRVYVYTNIQEFGGIEEESAPSPVSAEVLCGTGDTINVSGFVVPAGSGYNVTKQRIYRSVTGTGATSFFFVAEISAGTTSYIDSVPSAGLGEELRSLTWEEPPADLAGIVAHPGGFLIGFSGQELCMSEIGAPHAWPSQYRLSLNVDIVGLGVFGTSVVAMTKGYPQIITGITPESMSPEKVPELEPCVAKRSIVSDSTGVMYASPNGICMIGPGSAGLTTGNVMLRDEFQKFNPSTLRSAVYAGKYFGFYQQGTEYLQTGGFILDRTIPATPLSLTSVQADACYVDPESAQMYFLAQNRIQLWEGDKYNQFPFEWLSKRFIFTAPTNLSAFEVDADFDSIEAAEQLQELIAQIIAANQALFATGADLEGAVNSKVLNHFDLNGSILQNIPSDVDDRYVQVTVYCDDKLIHNGVYTKTGVYRLPSGYKGQAFEVKLAGNIELRYIKMAETVKELKAL